jgi:hypothetical protein
LKFGPVGIKQGEERKEREGEGERKEGEGRGRVKGGLGQGKREMGRAEA